MEKNETEYISKYPSLVEANEVDPIYLPQPTNDYKIEKPNKFIYQLNDPKNYWDSDNDIQKLSLALPFIGINYIMYTYNILGKKFERTKSFLNEYFKFSCKPTSISQSVKPIQKKQKVVI